MWLTANSTYLARRIGSNNRFARFPSQNPALSESQNPAFLKANIPRF